MANTQGACNSFKVELLLGTHAFGTTVVRGSTSADVLKVALYATTATINASTTAYTTSGEISGIGYTAGGIVVSNAVAPSNDISLPQWAVWTPSASFSWTSVVLTTSFNCALLYNATQGNRAIAAFTFASQTVSSGNFTLTMGANDVFGALLRWT